VWLSSKDQLFLGIWISMIIVLIFSLVMARLTLDKIRFFRDSRPNRHQVGEIFDERFELTNHSKLKKIWIEVTDESKIGKSINSRVIANLEPNRVRIHNSSMRLMHRGIFTLGPTKITSGDTLGLFKAIKKIKASKKLVVYPHIYIIEKLSFINSSEQGGHQLHTFTTQATPQANGIREYTPGDPLNRVHWPFTIKHGRLMVKEFDADTQPNAWVILDACKGKHIREKNKAFALDNRFLFTKHKSADFQLNRDSFEYAVSIATTLINHLIEHSFSVGFTSVGQEIVNIQPEKGKRQLNKILVKLAVLNDDGDIEISSIFNKIKSNIPRGSTVILITGETLENIEKTIYTSALNRMRLVPILINTGSFRVSPQISSREISTKRSDQYLEICYGDNIRDQLHGM